MLRSKSRSGDVDVGGKQHSSFVSRTFSSSKICRGDPLIDKNALVPIERRPSAKIISSSENQIVRVYTMQRKMEQVEEEHKLTKDLLDAAGADRDRALDQLQESKMMVHEANSRLSELTTVKELLSSSKKELAAKEKNIESMKLELDRAKKSENELANKVSSLSKLDDQLRIARISEARAMDICAESRKMIQVLEDELEKRKQSESKVSESGVSQTKELEAAKIELEESKLEIVSLREQLHKLESSSAASSREQNGIKKSDHIDPKTEPGQTSATSKAGGGPQSEIDILKRQLKAAIDGEEQSTKAMNDLALALKEVATESNNTKEKLISTESELEHVKEEAEQLKIMLDEAKREAEIHKNTADRLRLEAEESFLAWNGKERGFVDVIKQVEEDKALTQQENDKLTESLKAAENTSRTAKEENYKLRDILKQALNEANVAKEAASIAQQENSTLKDSIAEKEETLDSLTQENDKLRISEAAANEKIKELNRLLSQAHSDPKTEDKESGTAFMSPESLFDDNMEDYSKQEPTKIKQEPTAIKKKPITIKQEPTRIKKGFSFDLHQIKVHKKIEDDTPVDEDPVKAEALKGSIFDPSTETPRSEAHTPKQAPKLFHHHHRRHHHHHHRRKSSLSNAETSNTDDSNNLDGDSHHDSEGSHHSEESEADRQAHRRKKSVALKNFGYLLMRKSFTQQSHAKKEPGISSPDHD